MVNKKAISLSIQAGILKNHYPNSSLIWMKHNKFIWKYKLQPTALSINYQIKLVYNGYKPDVFIEYPKPLQLANDCTTLEHVYNTKTQKICLYYGKANEWNSTMLIANTIIPWTSEWLFHYEIWAYTGKWNGGGIHIKEDGNIKQ